MDWIAVAKLIAVGGKGHVHSDQEQHSHNCLELLFFLFCVGHYLMILVHRISPLLRSQAEWCCGWVRMNRRQT